MTTAELVQLLTSPGVPGVPALLKEAVERQPEITPYLLEIVERDAARLDHINANPDYCGHLYAIFLLAQFREARAYPLIVDFFSDPDDDYYGVFGDMVTEDLPQILASVYDGNDAPLYGLIENQNAYEFCRVAAVDALPCLVAVGSKTRENVLAYIDDLLSYRLERSLSAVSSFAVSAACDLDPTPCLRAIESAFEAGMIDTTVLTMNEVKAACGMDPAECLRYSRKFHPAPITDVPDLFKQWEEERARRDREEEQRAVDEMLKQSGVLAYRPPGTPDEVEDEYAEDNGGSRVRIDVKVLPNDPCPCRSGRKFKKCCGRVA